MARDLPKVSVKAWAWIISIGFHVVLIGVFALVRFSQSPGEADNNSSAAISIDQLKSITSVPITAPKPQIKKTFTSENTSTSKTLAKLPEHTDKSTPPLAASSALLPTIGSASLLPAGKIPNAGTTFFGHTIKHRKICYLVDCSGSMHGLLGKVQNELKNAVTNLRPDQYFYIIFFLEGDKLIESGNGLLTRATGSAKANAIAFIDSARLAGPTYPQNAVKRAMQIKDPDFQPPEVIYFLTDGFDLHTLPTDTLSSKIDDLRINLAPLTVINTIGFWTSPDDREILKNIAEHSGGDFLDVSLILND